MDLILNSGDQTVWIVCGSDYYGHLVERDLRGRHKITRSQFRAQVAISNVSHYADDLAHRWFVFIGGDSRLDVFANRVLAGEKLLRESLIDNDDGRRLLAVTFVEFASFKHRDTERLKVTVTDREKVSGRLIAFRY